jgi:hypothetical protein
LGMLGERGEWGGEGGGAVWVCWVREKQRERIDWVCVSSLGMLGEKEWESKGDGKIERVEGRRE